ncbi:MAG: hypothetical protein QOD10_1659, partial [Mycobacterium sp.]|nr:hypothetical protein [Mycobacterium sp.]
AVTAALAMALLGFAGGGRLGNFGDVGVDQDTFAPAVFLWFVGIGALTLAMSGGIARRPKRAKPVAGPEPEPEMLEDEPEPEPDTDDDEAELDEPELDVEMPADADLSADPEEHFVADGDATPGATSEETRGPAE